MAGATPAMRSPDGRDRPRHDGIVALSNLTQCQCPAFGRPSTVSSSCPALGRASTSFFLRAKQDVDGRDKPGHDGKTPIAPPTPSRPASNRAVVPPVLPFVYQEVRRLTRAARVAPGCVGVSCC